MTNTDEFKAWVLFFTPYVDDFKAWAPLISTIIDIQVLKYTIRMA